MMTLHLLIATDRPIIHGFFSSLVLPGHPITLTLIPVAPAAFEMDSQQLPAASVFVVDAVPDPMATLQLCQEVRHLRPSLPVVVVVCCSSALTSWHVNSFVATGVRGILDLQGSPETVWRALHGVAHGDMVISIQLRPGDSVYLGGIGSDGRPRPLAGTHPYLLPLVAQGLSDREIGEQLHLSQHTIKHQIERVRAELGARNRVALAAWAGQHGLHGPADSSALGQGRKGPTS